jgi:serine/threonine protein phosphatase PrpC
VNDVKTSPIAGQPSPPQGIITHRPLSQMATEAVKVVQDPAFFEDLGVLAGAFARLQAGAAGQQHLLPPELRGPAAPDRRSAVLAASDASQGLHTLAELYADQTIREEEVPALKMARVRLEKVQQMENAIGMLPPPLQQRLRVNLFDPLRVLAAAANDHAERVRGYVQERDYGAIKQRFATQYGFAEFKQLDVGNIQRRSDLNGARRYDVGDPIRVVTEDGIAAFGYVTARKDDGSLIAEWLDLHDRVQIAEMSPEKVAKENPLKIGETFERWGRRFWVTGLDDKQQLKVIDDRGTTYDALEVHNKLMPLERIFDPSKTAGLFAGDATSKTVFLNRARAGEVALHTHKGHNYKDWNEDAGCAFVDSWGRIYVGAFDQAGGEGNDPKAHGAASKIAGEAFFEQMRGVAQNHGSIADGEAALRNAIQTAHQRVIGRGKGEVTTFVGAMIDGREAVILNLGDSGAMHFDAAGGFKTKTQDQGIGNIIFDGIGYTHRDGRLPQPDTYRWPVRQGEYIVLGSDGLLDAKLTEQEIGWIIARAGSAEAATRALKEEVVKRMKTGDGKRDNLTISVVRVGSPAE